MRVPLLRVCAISIYPHVENLAKILLHLLRVCAYKPANLCALTEVHFTQVYIESLHTHIDVLHLPAQHRLEPCYTLQEEFMRHEHRSPKPGDIFKLRLLLPKFNEDLKDEAELAAIEAQQGRKRSLEEANCEAGLQNLPSYSSFFVICSA